MSDPHMRQCPRTRIGARALFPAAPCGGGPAILDGALLLDGWPSRTPECAP